MRRYKANQTNHGCPIKIYMVLEKYAVIKSDNHLIEKAHTVGIEGNN